MKDVPGLVYASDSEQGTSETIPLCKQDICKTPTPLVSFLRFNNTSFIIFHPQYLLYAQVLVRFGVEVFWFGI